jgi:hypothetical protein
LPIATTPSTSAATAEALPSGAGVVVVTVVVVPDEEAKAATPIGTDNRGVRASATVARRTVLPTSLLLAS